MPGGAALARPTMPESPRPDRRPGKAQPPPGIRTGTWPEHLAGRRSACPAYNASVPQARP
ncbi:hypothetical protein DMS22_16210 [Klebsiella variicola]|nr:hypothetical protein DMS22_16210 [Klebsiella variicola]